MNGILYITKRTFINSIKKSIRKPTFLIISLLMIAYFVFILTGFGAFLDMIGIKNAGQYVMIFIFAQLYFGVPSLVQLFQRKGIVFLKADVQFIFQSPVSPKEILIYEGMQGTIGISILLLVMSILGGRFFYDSVLLFALYFVCFLISNLFIDTSLYVLCFGNETIPEKVYRLIGRILYLMLFALVIGLLIQVLQHGYSIELVQEYIQMPIINLIPIFGWKIAFIQLIFYGPTWSNVLGSILCILLMITLPILAKKSKCDGAYYEDAEKFADDYEEAVATAKKTGRAQVVGKRKKYIQANINYKGYYAKAIFYRQLLEYKKNRTFIFTGRTFIFLLAGLVLNFVTRHNIWMPQNEFLRLFILPIGIVYYLTFVSFGQSKWLRELDSYITYLIPDTRINKTWNATKMDHIKTLIDCFLLAMIGGSALGLSLLQIVLTTLIGVSTNALQLYIKMIVETILNPHLGDFKVFSTLVFEVLLVMVMAIAIGCGAVVGILTLNMEIGFIISIFVSAVFAIGCFFLSALAFGKMEKVE